MEERNIVGEGTGWREEKGLLGDGISLRGDQWDGEHVDRQEFNKV